MQQPLLHAFRALQAFSSETVPAGIAEAQPVDPYASQTLPTQRFSGQQRPMYNQPAQGQLLQDAEVSQSLQQARLHASACAPPKCMLHLRPSAEEAWRV